MLFTGILASAIDNPTSQELSRKSFSTTQKSNASYAAAGGVRLVVVLLVCILFAPSAVAGAGAFVVQSIRADGAVAQAAWTGLLLETDHSPSEAAMDGHFGELRVVEYWSSVVIVEKGPARPIDAGLEPPQTRTRDFAAGSMETRASGADWYVGGHPASPTSSSLVLDGASFEGNFQTKGALETQTATVGETTAPWAYTQHIREPHMRVEGVGVVRIAGDALLKMYGPTLTIEADGETVTYETGLRPHPNGLPGHYVQRWVDLELVAADLEFRSDAAWQLALATAEVAWSGAALFTPLAGEFVEDDVSYRATGAPARLVGDLRASFLPLPSETPLARMDLSGDLHSTTLAGTPIARGILSVAPAAAGGLALLVGALLVLAALGGAWVTRRYALQRASAWSAEDCMREANEHLEHGRLGAALSWARAARARAPSSSHAALAEAYVLHELGQFDEAVAAYDAAARLGGEGEAAFFAAVAAARAGSPRGEVLDRLRRALDECPALAELAEEEDGLAPLRSDPAFARLLSRARSGGRAT